MTITEQFICGKHTAADCEDGIVITPHFAAVIDGSTSKTPLYIARGGRKCGWWAHPQNITDFVATKGLVEGNVSFDDRAYVSLNIL